MAIYIFINHAFKFVFSVIAIYLQNEIFKMQWLYIAKLTDKNNSR